MAPVLIITNNLNFLTNGVKIVKFTLLNIYVSNIGTISNDFLINANVGTTILMQGFISAFSGANIRLHSQSKMG